MSSLQLITMTFLMLEDCTCLLATNSNNLKRKVLMMTIKICQTVLCVFLVILGLNLWMKQDPTKVVEPCNKGSKMMTKPNPSARKPNHDVSENSNRSPMTSVGADGGQKPNQNASFVTFSYSNNGSNNDELEQLYHAAWQMTLNQANASSLYLLAQNPHPTNNNVLLIWVLNAKP